MTSRPSLTLNPNARLLRLLPVLLVLLLLTAGCLPSSQKELKRGMWPADSLSQQLAAGVPVDTLEKVGETTLPSDFPTTLVMMEGGAMAVADTRRGILHRFDAGGAHVGEMRQFRYPYMAGRRGDTLAVFSRETGRLDFVHGDSVVRTVTLPAGGNTTALVGADAIWLKTAAENASPFVARFDDAGREVARHPLAGPFWRHMGLLRAWDGALVSLSGYRPVVDVVPAGAPAGSAADTLALAGFDTPQFVRSYQFMIGEVKEPPLLTSAAQPLGDRLFVINLRPGWLQVDVFDRQGRLERSLVERRQSINTDFFPVDLGVRQVEGGYELAVLVQRPRAQILRYRWMTGL
jgi:hypothetical protein